MENLETKKRHSVHRAVNRIKQYWLNDVGSVFLLFVLVFTVFVLPVLIEYKHIDDFFVNTVFLTLFFAGIWSSDNKYLIGFTSLLFLVQLFFRLLRFSDYPFEFYLWERVVGLINMIVFIFLNIRLLFRNDEITLFRVTGAINVFFLIAIFGSFALEVIQLLVGSSIKNSEGHLHALTGIDEDYPAYIYFSMVSMTTVGYGDYTPANIMAKMTAVMLSTTGILYPAIVIAKLVGSSGKKHK